MKVSVIIPCYNVEKYISDCIKSVEQQNYKDMEVICVNDGSSDRTEAIIKEIISTSFLSIKLINQENNGAPSARNIGVKNCSGDYIQFLDVDDILTPDKIKNQVDISLKNKLPDIIIGSYQRVSMKGELLVKRIYDQNNCGDVWHHLFDDRLGITSSNLFKYEVFKNGIQWNENLQSCQEYELMFQGLKKNENIVFDPEINTTIRVRDSGSISQSNIDKKWETYVQLKVDILNFLKETKTRLVTDELLQVLFNCIRMLYPHNSTKALSYFKKYIPGKFAPVVSRATGKGYIFIYKLLGFRNTEKVRLYIAKNKAY